MGGWVTGDFVMRFSILGVEWKDSGRGGGWEVGLGWEILVVLGFLGLLKMGIKGMIGLFRMVFK